MNSARNDPASFGRSTWSNSKKTPKPLNMDSALALLRRELLATHLQDKALHKQLLGLQASIVGLKTELRIEREQNWQWENGELDREPTRVPLESRAIATEVLRENPAIVTKVEVIDNHEPKATKLQVNHAKQDSGILTDDEGNSDEADESIGRKPTKNFVRLQSGKSNSFHAGSRGKEGNKANFERSWSSHSLKPAKVLIRSVEVPKNKRENVEVTSNLYSPRQRAQTMPSGGSFYRVASMPVINEVPTSERATTDSNKDTAFGVYARHESDRIDNNNAFSNGQRAIENHQPKKLPVVFHSLQRHDSMPILSSHARKRGEERLRAKSNNNTVTNTPKSIQKTNQDSQTLTRRVSTSYVDLRKVSAPVEAKPLAVVKNFSHHEPETQRLTQKISTSYVDLRRTSKSPSASQGVDCNGLEPRSLQRVSTSYIDIRARSSLRETARDKNYNETDNHKLIRRVSSSYVDLRSTSSASDERRSIKDINCNEQKPMHHHKLYRSHSQTSLV